MQQSIQRGLDQLPGQPHHHPLLSSTENAAEDREERYRRVRRRGEVSDPWLFANSGRLSSSSARGRHQTRADNLIQDEYEEQLTAMNADDSDDDSDSDFIVSSRLFASGSGVGSYYNNNATTNLLRRRATIRRSGLQQRRATTLSSSSSSPLNIAFTVNPEPFQPGDFGSSSDDNTSGESSNGIFGSGSNIGSNDRLASRRDSLNSIGTSSSSSSSRSRGRLETRDMERDISVYNNNNDNTTQLLAPQNTRFPSQSTSRGELNIDSPTPASQTSTFMTASQLRAQQLVRILRRRQSGLAPTVSSSTNPLSSSPVNPDFTVSNSNSNDSNGGEDVVQRTINQRVSSLSFQDLSTSPAPSSPAYTLLPSHESSSQATVVSSPNTTLGEPNNLQQEQQVHQQQQQQQSQPSALNYSLRTTARSRDERMAYILRSASTTISELSSNINERFSRISSSEITGNVNPQQRQNEGLSSVDEANNLGDRLLTFNQRRNRLLASAAVDDPIAFRLVPSQPPNIEDVPSSRNSSETNYINNNNNRNNNTSSNSTNSSSSMIPRSVNNPSVSVALNSLMASTFQRWQSLRQDLATAAGLSLQTARLFQQSSALLNSGGRLNQDGESGGTSFADHSPPGQLPPENPDGDDLMPTLDLSVNGGSLTRPTSMPSVTSLLSTLHRNATASIGADRGEASTTITTTTTGTTNSAFDQPGM